MSTLNVQEYGAVGDGQTDDREAIQSAIDDAEEGDTVYIPSTEAHYLIGQGGAGGGIVLSDALPDNVTITGDGPESFLRLDDLGSNTAVIMIVVNGDTIEGLELSNLRLSGNIEANSRTGGAGYSGIHLDASNGPDTGHNISIQNLKVEDTPGMGIGWRTGMDTVSIEHVTVENTSNQHGIQIDSATGNVDEGEIPNSLRSVKIINAGQSSSHPGNGVNINGSCVIEEFYIEGAVQGSKISNGGLTAILRDGRFAEHNNNHSFRETVSEDRGDWRCELDNVRFEDSDSAALRFEGYSGASQDLLVLGEVEVTNVDRTGAHGFAVGITGHQDFEADTLYIHDVPSDGLSIWSWSGNGSIEELYYDDIGGTPSVGDIIEFTETFESDMTLSVPSADDVGAWSETDSTSETTEALGTWSPQWNSTEDDWNIIEKDNFEGNHALQYQSDETGLRALSWDTVGEQETFDVIDQFEVAEFSEAEEEIFAGIFLRASGEAGEENGYVAGVSSGSSAVTLGKYSAGSFEVLGDSGSVTVDQLYRRRIQIEDDVLQVKIWPASESEPEEWDLEASDSELQSGWIGVGASSSAIVNTDIISVGIDGESPQLEPPSEEDDS